MEEQTAAAADRFWVTVCQQTLLDPGGGFAVQTGEQTPKAHLEESLAVQLLCILTESKERKYRETQSNLCPSIKDNDSTCRYEKYLVPTRTVYYVPAVGYQGNDGILV